MDENTAEDMLHNLFAELNIDPTTSRSKAKRNKPETVHRCVLCLYRFHTKELLGTHLKEVHRAISSEITQEYKDANLALEKNPNDPICIENRQLALMKVTLLEKYRQTKYS